MRMVQRIIIALVAFALASLFNCLWLYLNGPFDGKLLLGINVLFLVASLLALIVWRDKTELTPRTGKGYEEDPTFKVQDRSAKLLSDEHKR